MAPSGGAPSGGGHHGILSTRPHPTLDRGLEWRVSFVRIAETPSTKIAPAFEGALLQKDLRVCGQRPALLYEQRLP